MATTNEFTDPPLASVSGQFSLTAPTTGESSSSADVLPLVDTRPWGLRDLVPASSGATLPPMRYDHDRQLTVLDDGSGRAFIDVVSGPPTAPTTQTVDGEDPPSSEDWKNDFCPDDPCPY
jgi:putative ATP-grasp target RiPP